MPDQLHGVYHFNPRSPCGERQEMSRLIDEAVFDFNPRSPCGERLPHGRMVLRERRISIHAPRAGSDIVGAANAALHENFNPRSPCGERQQYIVLLQVQSAIYAQSAILSIVIAIKGRRLLIEFGAKACGIPCVLQIRTHKTSGFSTEIVSFEP